MIQITRRMRTLVAAEPADFRKGHDGLAGVCRKVLASDPFSGRIPVFRNRRGTSAKSPVYVSFANRYPCQEVFCKRSQDHSVCSFQQGHNTCPVPASSRCLPDHSFHTTWQTADLPSEHRDRPLLIARTDTVDALSDQLLYRVLCISWMTEINETGSQSFYEAVSEINVPQKKPTCVRGGRSTVEISDKFPAAQFLKQKSLCDTLCYSLGAFLFGVICFVQMEYIRTEGSS